MDGKTIRHDANYTPGGVILKTEAGLCEIVFRWKLSDDRAAGEREEQEMGAQLWKKEKGSS